MSLANGRSLQRNYHQRGVDFDLTPEQELIRDTVRPPAITRVTIKRTAKVAVLSWPRLEPALVVYEKLLGVSLPA